MPNCGRSKTVLPKVIFFVGAKEPHEMLSEKAARSLTRLFHAPVHGEEEEEGRDSSSFIYGMVCLITESLGARDRGPSSDGSRRHGHLRARGSRTSRGGDSCQVGRHC